MSRVIQIKPRLEPPIQLQPAQRGPRWSIDTVCLLVWFGALAIFGCTILGLWDVLAMICQWGPYR